MDEIDKRVSEQFDAFERDGDVSRAFEAFEVTEGAQRDVARGDAAARMMAVSRWLRFFAALDRYIDPHWDPNALPVKSATLPAEHGVVYPSGEVDPSTIPDAAERARYERELEANKRYARHYTAQLALRRIDERAMGTLGRLLTEKYNATPADREELERLLSDSSASAELKERLRGLVAGRRA